MAKSIPPTVKHVDCRCKVIKGNFGPHKGKIVCEDHNNSFIQWLPKYYFEDWPDIKDEFIIETYKRQTKISLYNNGTIFDKIKYSSDGPTVKTEEILKKLKGVLK